MQDEALGQQRVQLVLTSNRVARAEDSAAKTATRDPTTVERVEDLQEIRHLVSTFVPDADTKRSTSGQPLRQAELAATSQQAQGGS